MRKELGKVGRGRFDSLCPRYCHFIINSLSVKPPELKVMLYLKYKGRNIKTT